MGDHGRRRQAAAPLLEKKGSTGTGVDDGYCIEGCPGCVVDRRKAASYGIPYGSFLFVWIVTLCTGNSLPSFILSSTHTHMHHQSRSHRSAAAADSVPLFLI
jgi:hypothetical protein